MSRMSIPVFCREYIYGWWAGWAGTANHYFHLHCPPQEWLDELGSNGTGDDVIIVGTPVGLFSLVQT